MVFAELYPHGTIIELGSTMSHPDMHIAVRARIKQLPKATTSYQLRRGRAVHDSIPLCDIVKLGDNHERIVMCQRNT